MKCWVAAVILSATFAGCTYDEVKEKLLPSFNINIPDINLVVPPLQKVLTEEIPVGALKSHINMDSTIREYTAGAFGANAVHLVRVRKIVIKLSNADSSDNLSNFESARMRIYNDTASTDIAKITFPATFSDSISVVPTPSPDISNYLRGTSLNYNLYWKNRKVIKKSLKLIVQVTVAVQ